MFLKEQRERRFKNNKVCTSKYNCLTFLPLNLFEQFTKMANMYFLFMALLQLVPVSGLYDAYGAATTFMPLFFVVGISMIKDLVEDSGRHRQDSKENSQIIRAIPRGGTQLQDVKSKDLQVGCIVKIFEDQFFPADILLL